MRSVREYISTYAPGRTFLDVGGMWAINGAHSFLAEELGATRVVCFDLDRTAEFEAARHAKNSEVEFISGDATSKASIQRVGVADIVWCFGVLYHVPDPHALLRSLRTVCGQTLILETLTVPEIPGAANAGVYIPRLPAAARRQWDTRARGSARVQFGISTGHDDTLGYANNFWALSPSGVTAVIETAGFKVVEVAPSPQGVFRHVFVSNIQPWNDPFSDRTGSREPESSGSVGPVA